MMKQTPRVVECNDEETATVEQTTTPIVEEPDQSPLKNCLKKLTKQITKYKRQVMKANSEEDQKKYKQLIDYINDLRFILKLSAPNQCMLNKVLAYIEYPETYQDIQNRVIAKIEADEF